MTLPEKGTPEYEVFLTAIEIAAFAPTKQGKYVSNAGIRWRLIHRLRTQLDELGIDWRAAKT